MSDWEEASIGDPAADFAFTQEFFSDVVRYGETLWGLDHAIEYYFTLCGIRISRTAVDFYRLVQSLKMMVYSESAAIGVHSTPNAHIRQAWTGTEVSYVGKRIIASAMGLSAPLSSSRFAELNKSVN
jgi:aminoglycoside phosphotransferase (APT) family kinase protein